jgi:MoaA/NifB/PqqE/SkfB family radical SAM enzyme
MLGIKFFTKSPYEKLRRDNERLAKRERVTRPDVVRAWPQYLTIANTFKCNLDCPMCFKQLDDFSNMSLPDMDWAIFEKVAHEVFPHLRIVNLSVSGEPLVSRHIFQELEMLRRYGVKTDITTNGMPLARPGLIDALLPVCRSLTISFDGATKETFEYVRKNATWEVVLRNLKLFNEARMKLQRQDRPIFRMSHVYQHANLLELERLVELAHEIGIDSLGVQHIYVHRSENSGTSALNHPRLVNEMLARARARARDLGLSAQFPDPLAVPEGQSEPKYEAPSREWLVAEAASPLVTRPYRADSQSIPGPLAAASAAGPLDSNEALLARREHGAYLPRAFDYGVPQLGDSLIPASEIRRNSCLYPWREAFVDWTGTVSPCCSPALLDAANMGDLRKQSFWEIWNGPTYRRLRRSLREGRTYKFCRHCYVVNPEDPVGYCLD